MTPVSTAFVHMLMHLLVTEFIALARVFPNAQLRLCLFHVNKNVARNVRAAYQAEPEKVESVTVLLEEMTRLGCTLKDRQKFIHLVRHLLDDVLPLPAGAAVDPEWSTAHVVTELIRKYQ